MKKILYLVFLFPVLAIGQSSDQNYAKSTVYKIGTLTSITSPAVADATVQVTYFDGLGRPKQRIDQQQSGVSTNLVTHIEYDVFSRQTKEYLPFKSSAMILDYITNGQSATASFYSTYSGGTTNPWVEKIFDGSPLNRIVEQAAPGNSWANNYPTATSDHTTKIVYDVNIANEVPIFEASAIYSSTYELYATALSQTGTAFYPAGTLYKTITKDENWLPASVTNNTTEEFKDKDGKVILKRTYGKSYIDATTESVVAHDTYYVYDPFGNLTYVIPPNVTIATVSSQLDGLCYQYKYDDQNRLVEKKLPGKQWEFVVYDKLDRIVATGPRLSPFTNASGNGWLINKYDSYDRPILTGWIAVTGTMDSALRKTLQASYKADTTISENKVTTSTTMPAGGVAFNYSTIARPTSGYEILTVNIMMIIIFPILRQVMEM
jgi:YD repeat-containing protein